METEDKFEAFVKDLEAFMNKYADFWVPGMPTMQYLLYCYYSGRPGELIRIDDIAKAGAGLELEKKEKRTSI